MLVVEDSPVLRTLATRQLEQLGYTVRSVATGQAAIEELPRRDYCLVLMDCHLPDIDGIELTKRIRKAELKSKRHIPILAVTAAATEADRERCLSAGMDDYLSKPYEVADLEAKIQTILLAAQNH